MLVFRIITSLLLLVSLHSFSQSLEKGTDLINQGRTDLAITHYQTLLRNEQTPNQRHKTYQQLGLAYFSIGSYASANQYMKQAYNINLELFDSISDERASIYNDLGLVNSTYKPKKALEYYKKNQEIYIQKYGKNDEHLVSSFINIGVINIQQNELSEGITQLNKALSLNINNQKRKAFIFGQLGQAYLQNNQDELAETFVLDALAIYSKTLGEKHPEIAQTYISLANIQLYRNDHRKAINYYQSALIANSNQFTNTDIFAIPTIETSSLSPTLFLNTLHLKALAFEQLYFDKSLNRKDLLTAEKHLFFCNTLFENIQRTQPDESDKLALSTLSLSIYQDAVRVSMELAEVSIKKKQYYNKAYYYAENSSASLLLDAIQDAKAKNFSGLPKEILEKEKSLKATITSLRKKLAEHSTTDLENELLATTNRYTILVNMIEKDFPKYYDLKFSRKKTTITDIQQKLPVGETILQYFIDESNTTLYTFVITNKKFKVVAKSIPSDFSRNLIGYRNSIKYDQKDFTSSLGEKISKTLLPKLPRGTQNIVIIPTGQLHKLPFETLPYDKQFLIQKFEVSYHYTSSLHTNCLDNHYNEIKSIALFAPVTFTGQNTLLGTEAEVKKIHTQFSNHQLSATTYLRTDASESYIKSNSLRNYDIIHFATHGEVNSNHPELSKIFLTADETEDGALHTGEIYNLNLKSSLVTLSACETGLGKQQKGEGVMGLSRALIYAGANNLIVSYWKVDDNATTELMTQFYTHLLTQKSDYKSAIRASKLALLNSETYSSPKYWSAFVLIGE